MTATGPDTAQAPETAEDVFRVPHQLSVLITSGPCAGQVFKPKDGGYHITVGRTKARASKNPLHIKDQSVSEKHAEVSWNGKAWVLQDVGSSNGTRHNGFKLISNRDIVQLSDGDEVQFGDKSSCKFQITPQDMGSLKLEHMLQCQYEVVAQGIEAAACAEVAKLRSEWEAAKAELQAAAVAAR